MIGEGAMTKAEAAQAASEEIAINREQARDAILAHLDEIAAAVQEAFESPHKNALRTLWINGRGELVALPMRYEVADLLE